MGSSAGAHSIGHHLFQQDDKPALFHKAVLESGAATARGKRISRPDLPSLRVSSGCHAISYCSVHLKTQASRYSAQKCPGSVQLNHQENTDFQNMYRYS